MVVAVVIAAAVIAGATYVGVRTQVESAYAAEADVLAAVGRLRVAQVAAWRDERIGDVQADARSPWLGQEVVASLQDPGNTTLNGQLVDRLRMIGAEKFENVLLVRPDGTLLASATAAFTDIGATTRDLIRAVSVDRAAPAFDDLVIASDPEHVHVDVAAAVPGADGHAVAVLILRSNPLATLYPRLLAWPTPSASGETLLVRRHGDRVMFLTPPRLAAGLPPAIDLTRADLPAARAVLGAIGRFEGRDYRGVDVLADLRSVPRSTWYLVDKVDASEVATIAVLRAGVVLALAALATIVAAGLAVLLFVDRQRRILRRMHDADRERAAAASRFGRLFALARDVLLLTDPSRRVIDANEAAVAAYGYPRDALLGMDLLDLRAAGARETFDLDMAAAEDPAGARFETTHRRRDGTSFPVEVSVRSLEIDGQRFRQSIVRDITERRSAEAALRERMDELHRWSVAASDRESRIIALKQEVNELLTALGRDQRYASQEQEDTADG